MSTAFDETVTIMRGIASGDSSSGGINHSTSTPYLRGRDDSNVGLWRAGDTNLRTMLEPFVVLSLVGQQEIDKIACSAGSGSSQLKQVAMVIQMEIVTKGDAGFAIQDAIADRLRVLFHKTSFSGLSGSVTWDMNRMIFTSEGHFPMAESDSRRRSYIRARLDARRGAA